MPSSCDGTVDEIDSRLCELRREDGHVLVVEGFGCEFLDAAERERRQGVRRVGRSSSCDARGGLA